MIEALNLKPPTLTNNLKSPTNNTSTFAKQLIKSLLLDVLPIMDHHL